MKEPLAFFLMIDMSIDEAGIGFAGETNF